MVGGTGGRTICPPPSHLTPSEDVPVIPTSGYAAFDNHSPLKPFQFERRDPGPSDVQVDILFCGVCHSDLHTARSEWGGPATDLAHNIEEQEKQVKQGTNAAPAAASPKK